MNCRYLEGENIAPHTTKQARLLIGKQVAYLQEGDIDRSGRGLFFPRYGTIAEVYGKNIAIDTPGNFTIYLPDLVEMAAKQEAADD